MSFRELVFQDELTSSAHTGENEKHPLVAVLENQSPIMKFWFVLMVVNMVMFLFIIR